MNLGKRTRAALAAAITAGALAMPLAATGASAASHHVPAAMSQQEKAIPANTSGPFNMGLTNDFRFRWVSNGVGNQVTIGDTGYMSVYWVPAGNDGYPLYEFQNGNGHCLYANGAGQLIIGQNGCDPNRNDQRFEVVPAANGGFSLGSRMYLSSVVLVYNNQNGKPVYVKPFSSGNWDNWNK